MLEKTFEETKIQKDIMSRVSNDLCEIELSKTLDRNDENNYLFHLAIMDYHTNKMSDEDFIVARAEHLYKVSYNQK